MFEDFLKKRYEEIELDSEKKKKSIQYITNLIKADAKRYIHAFGLDNSQRDLESILYKKVVDTINDLAKEYCRPFGIKQYFGETYPHIELGWTEFAEKRKKGLSNYINLTEEGIKIINEYRLINGLLSLDEERERNKL